MLRAIGESLTVDVGTEETRTESIDEVLSSYVGGRGVGTMLAYDRLPFDVEPLSAENGLLFAIGPMQASTMSFTGRMNCTGVSPLTDGLLSSNAGGFTSWNFADTGYAALFGADYATLLEVGDRIVTLVRHFNNQRGFDRRLDTLPYDLDGFDAALDEYYEIRGWSGDGIVPDGRVPA